MPKTLDWLVSELKFNVAIVRDLIKSGQATLECDLNRLYFPNEVDLLRILFNA